MSTDISVQNPAQAQLNFQRAKADILSFLQKFAKHFPNNPYFAKLVKIVEQSEDPKQLQQQIVALHKEILDAIKQQRDQLMSNKTASAAGLVKSGAVLQVIGSILLSLLTMAALPYIHSLANEVQLKFEPEPGGHLTSQELAILHSDPEIKGYFWPSSARQAAKEKAIAMFRESLDPVDRAILATQVPNYDIVYLTLDDAKQRELYLQQLQQIIEEAKRNRSYMSLLPDVASLRAGTRPIPTKSQPDFLATTFETIFGKPFVNQPQQFQQEQIAQSEQPQKNHTQSPKI